jgi:hypothetical protein
MRALVAVVVAGCGGAQHPATLADRVHAQEHVVEAFFGEKVGPYELVVVGSHADMAKTAAAKWHATELPCFAVAMGSGSTLLLLEPAKWASDACDHAHDTPADVDRVIAHELVHVFHGQHRPGDRELDKLDDGAAWFAEGLAAYAADQLQPDRMAQLASAPLPDKLAAVWTGKARYPAAGTLVRVVDRRVGRAKLLALLPLSTNAELLAAIGLDEAGLLAAWRTDLGR